MSSSPTSLEPLLAVATAAVDEHGALREANAGFLRLANLADTPPAGTRVDRLFIQPDFAMLVGAQPDADGQVYLGLLTLGEFAGQTRTLHARIWREGAQLRLLAEYDIEGLERLNTIVLDLNRDYAQLQVELAQTNIKLQATIVHLKETQKKLIEAKKMASLGILVAGVAHEINTPLGVGLLAASSLQKQARELAQHFAERSMSRSELEHYLESAQSSSDLVRRNLERIGHLVDTFRQVAVEGHPMEKHTFRLKECLDDVILSLGDGLPPERIEVHIVCDPKLEIESVPSDWASIFMNLIGNSLKYGFKGRARGRIDIGVESDPKGLRVDYRDDGMGMTANALAKIFDPFFTTDMQSGMGLGMNIVYNLITHRFGGSIRCSSQPGEGVHFHIDVPSGSGR